MNVFFDLDGTLLDSRPRLYQLFQKLVPESKFTFEDYWDLKRKKINHKQILKTRFNYSEQQFFSFEKEWMEEIERTEWLALDQPFEGLMDFLLELKKKHTLYVVTSRQFEKRAVEQIEDHGFHSMFQGVLVTNQKREKSELIKDNVFLSEEDWIVGDTGKDILTGKKLGIHTAAVLSGFLSEESLIKYNPDVIIGNVSDLQFK